MATNGSQSSNGTLVPDVRLWYSPSTVVTQDHTYVFHNAAAANPGRLYLKRYNKKTGGWTVDEPINSVQLSESPCALVYKHVVYVFHQGSGNTNTANQLWFSIMAANESWVPDKQITGIWMTGSPNAVLYDGYIRIFYQAQNNELRYYDFKDDDVEVK